MYKVVENQPDFLLINKDSGVDFHKGEGEIGLPAMLREREGIAELFPVHRLDKMTSGLLLFAKNRETAKELAAQFAKGEVQKCYLAISDRRPKKKQGVVVGDMAKSRRGSWKLLRSKENPARTRFISMALSEGLRLFILKPLTGKTHQLRVALKSVGAPALGDPLYHPEEYKKGQLPDRGYLHAYYLSFKLGLEPHEFVCLPDTGKHFLRLEFLSLVSKLERPWDLFSI